jgi:hypothetical protein
MAAGEKRHEGFIDHLGLSKDHPSNCLADRAQLPAKLIYLPDQRTMAEFGRRFDRRMA